VPSAAACKKVRDLHRRVWPDEMLSDEAIYDLASRIETVRDARNGEKRKRRSNESASKRVQKYGRLFLRHLPNVKAHLVDPQAIDKMTAAEIAVGAALEAAKPVRFRPNPGEFIAQAVKETWVGEGKDSPSKNKLRDFVTKALAEAGLHLSPETVTEMLRGRQNRKRSGKGLPAKKRRSRRKIRAGAQIVPKHAQ
jgi:hypothetical protein